MRATRGQICNPSGSTPRILSRNASDQESFDGKIKRGSETTVVVTVDAIPMASKPQRKVYSYMQARVARTSAHSGIASSASSILATLGPLEGVQQVRA